MNVFYYKQIHVAVGIVIPRQNKIFRLVFLIDLCYNGEKSRETRGGGQDEPNFEK